MTHKDLGVIEKDFVGPLQAHADTQLGFLAAQWTRPNASNAVAKPANGLKNLAAKGHIASDEIAHRSCSVGHTHVRAPDDPIEFAWEPTGALRAPTLVNCSATESRGTEDG